MRISSTANGRRLFAFTRWTILAWGVLHVVGGSLIVAITLREGAEAGLSDLGSAAPVAAIPSDPGPVVKALLAFHGLNIVWFGLATLYLAQRRSMKSLGAALMVMAAADFGLIVSFLIPGHMRWIDGLWGPLLLVLSASTYLLLRATLGERDSTEHGRKKRVLRGT